MCRGEYLYCTHIKEILNAQGTFRINIEMAKSEEKKEMLQVYFKNDTIVSWHNSRIAEDGTRWGGGELSKNRCWYPFRTKTNT